MAEVYMAASMASLKTTLSTYPYVFRDNLSIMLNLIYVKFDTKK